MRINKIVYLLLIFILANNLFAQFGFQQKSILKFESYKSFDKIQPGGEVKLAFKIDIDDEWHINSNNPKEDFLIPTELIIKTDPSISVGEIIYPKAHDIKLDISDTPLSVFEGESYIASTIKIPKDIDLGEKQVVVELTYQGCNNVTCMAPNTIIDTLSIVIVDQSEQIQELNADIFNKIGLDYSEVKTETSDDSLAGQLESSGLLLTLIIVFLGGLALNLTPCVYPLIPITIGYFGGQSEGRTSRLFLMGLFYVLGMA
jgi:thiol:disulfide interchange protein DsbD